MSVGDRIDVSKYQYLTSPVNGITIVFDFYKKNQAETDRIDDWKNSYTPNPNIFARVRRKLSFLYTELLKCGIPSSMVVETLDYITNSNHLNHLDEYVNQKNIKEAKLIIFYVVHVDFIKDGEYIGENFLEKVGKSLLDWMKKRKFR